VIRQNVQLAVAALTRMHIIARDAMYTFATSAVRELAIRKNNTSVLTRVAIATESFYALPAQSWFQLKELRNIIWLG
jgi:hypothetical protein